MDRNRAFIPPTVALAAILALAIVAPTATQAAPPDRQDTDSYNVTYKTRGAGVMTLTKNDSTNEWDIVITNGDDRDTILIKLMKELRKANDVPEGIEINSLSTDASFRKIKTEAAIRRVLAPDGAIENLTAKPARRTNGGGFIGNFIQDGVHDPNWTDQPNISAMAIGKIKIKANPNSSNVDPTNVYCRVNSPGAYRRPTKAWFYGCHLANWSTTEQPVKFIKVASTRNKDYDTRENYVAEGCVGPPPAAPETRYGGDVDRLPAQNVDTSKPFIVAASIDKIDLKGAIMNAREINSMTPNNKTKINGRIQLYNKIGPLGVRLGYPADIMCDYIFTQANKLDIKTKGGNIDGYMFVCENEVQRVQANEKHYRDPNLNAWFVRGGVIGDPSEAPDAPETRYGGDVEPSLIETAPYAWEGQLWIFSGGAETDYNEPDLGARVRTRINKVQGDLGVFAGLFADADIDPVTGMVTAGAEVRKVSVTRRVSRRIEHLREDYWQQIQGFAYTTDEPRPTHPRRMPFDPEFFTFGPSDPLPTP